ncbi:MAG: preprotein translocase subunit SecE [Clostridia bacterium]|nr:preprotein translocase subunit SecE [Clostridia bacterium]
MAEATAQKKKSGNRIVRFFKEVKSEMKKVVWPSRKQVIKNTLIVIASVVIIGVVIWALDMLFSLGLEQIIKTK